MYVPRRVFVRMYVRMYIVSCIQCIVYILNTMRYNYISIMDNHLYFPLVKIEIHKPLQYNI